MPYEAYPGLPESFQPTPVNPKRNPNLNGRKPPGAVAKITRDLKHGIIDAAVAYGSDGNGKGGLTGYLFFLAGKHPKAFAGLLGKMLPLQVNGSIQSVVGQINVVSVPVDHYLSPDDVRKLAPAPPAIDHESSDDAAPPSSDPGVARDLDAA
ncbi:hypothetical protein [Bradyrhizobium lablabi]|uniref:hypothetical protein n=1 Tax=Bradyrhizobium lablabi TaxID=722472 RepID=UPI0007C7962C|nr:hypothetical protein [Bradyrhizobium lablabi]